MEHTKIKKPLDHYRGKLACRITLADAGGWALFEFGYVDIDPNLEQS